MRLTSLLLLVFLACLGFACAGTPEPASPASSVASPEPTPLALPASTVVPQPLPTAAPTTVPTPASPDEPEPAGIGPDPGALIRVEMTGRVGVLLDEFPPAMRDRVAAALMAEPADAWLVRARRQVQLTRLRLNFRDYAYEGKGQLPLPPASEWQFDLALPATRAVIQGHDLVVMDYAFETTMLTDAASPGVAEPALAEVGGVWEEPFVFPADPFLLLQRTGNACVNEAGFPPESFDSENVWLFYDHACTADSAGALGCHRTVLPAFSCREALANRVGEVESMMRFERLAWDPDLADRVRLGGPPISPAADLAVVGADLAVNRVEMRFVDDDDCALEEGAVGGTGWRRLLLFDATVENVGAAALHVGLVVAEDPVNNVFEYSPCHDHFHYSNYGEFYLLDGDELSGSKQAFCVQSTSRYANDESSPLTHDYSCSFQGIQAGWVDEYVAGLDAQWMDITDLPMSPEGTTVTLGFRSNGDGFLCEGTPLLDAAGQTIWEPTGFTTEDGAPVNRPACDFTPEWESNNDARLDVALAPAGSFVTEPCQLGESGPVRNCDFAPLVLDGPGLTCVPGEAVELTLQTADGAAPQVVRACEWSAALGGVACGREDAVANVIVGPEPTTVGLTCPAVRDGAPGEGGFALYGAPVWPGDAPADVTRTAGP